MSVVRVGSWLYDGAVPMAVRILQQNWDLHYEEGFDEDPPHLNAEGFAFYVVYGDAYRSVDHPTRTTYASYSRTCLSLEEAAELAAETLGETLVWGWR